jgi:hypothetical protein
MSSYGTRSGENCDRSSLWGNCRIGNGSIALESSENFRKGDDRLIECLAAAAEAR